MSKRNYKKIVGLIVCITCLLPSVSGFDWRSLLNREKGAGLPFFSDIEFRRRQLEELESRKQLLKKQTQEETKVISGKLQTIELEAEETKNKLKKEVKTEKDHLEKKLAVLGDRKQNTLRLQELWKEIETVIVKHINLVKEFIEELSGGGEEGESRFIYLWKHLEETKSKIDDFTNKIVAESAKKETLQKELSAEKEELVSLKQREELQKAENEKVFSQLSAISDKEEEPLVESFQDLKLKAGLGEQQLALLREKENFTERKIKKLTLEISYKEDETELFKYKRNKFNASLARIQHNLVLDPSDVARADTEVEAVTKLVSKEKNKLSKERELKKSKREALTQVVVGLEKKLAELKEANQKENVEYYSADVDYQKAYGQVLILKKEIDRIDINQEYLDAQVHLKMVKAKIINILHKINIGTDNIDEWLVDVKNQKRSVEHAKKVLMDKRDGAINDLSKINADLESLKTKRREIKQKRDTVFKGNNKKLYEVLNTLKEAEIVFESYRPVIEKYFSRISEFIFRQEEIMSQHDYIIVYLESRRRSDNIWKRSSRAISFDSFIKSVYDAEDFFKDFFWDTPQYLNPAILFYSIKQATGTGFLGVLIIFTLFILLFLFFKWFFGFVIAKLKESTLSRLGHAYRLFSTVVSGFFEFILKHYALVFTWFFVFIHIVFDVTYFGIFSKGIFNSYLITLFYLASVIIFSYLSFDLLLYLKTLNQKIHFLLFPDETQKKFLSLIGVVFYSSSILLCFRQSFLEYRPIESAFPKVLLAAYSLIIVIVILLFFTKEDILKLISAQNSFLVWLRKKIDKYYYPVFVFCVGLLILSNPYIGYSNLAWYLSFAVPAAGVLIGGAFFIHHFIRKFSLGFFIKEEDENVIDKFEHAKTYYGFFIVATFVFLALVTFVLVARIWGFEGYTLGTLWKNLSEEWVFKISPTEKLGFVEMMQFVLSIASGFVFSSLFDKFILGRLFDIFRPEPGLQNTISRILHYVILFIAVVLGFNFIGLQQYAVVALGSLALGIGFALKDQISDFIAGFFVLIERPVEIGHFVETGDLKGTVKKISARATTIRTARNFSVIVPNRDLISKPIINWGQGRNAVGFEVTVSVAYHSDPESVKNIIREAVQQHPLILRVPKIIVRLLEYKDSGMLFFIRAFLSPRRVRDLWDVESDVRFAIFSAFKENDICIPFPQNVVHFADGDGRNPIKIKFDSDYGSRTVERKEVVRKARARQLRPDSLLLSVFPKRGAKRKTLEENNSLDKESK